MIHFGLDVPATTVGGEPHVDPVAAARAAEAAGFDFVSASDHPCGTDPSYENWTMLTWMLAATSRLRVLPRVLGMPYRNPAMVAKMAETLDRLSGGRLLLGLGGGYSDDEFRAFGLGVPSPRDKVDGLDEAIQVIRGLWTRPSFTFAGRIHRTDAATIAPRPERPIPIWVGTFGPRALAVTGRLADGWIPSLGHAPPETIPALRHRIARAADRAGRSIEEITCGYHLDVPPGGTDEVVETLLGYLRLGFSAFNFRVAGADRDERVAWLGAEVLPVVRQAG
ncbi:probable F420-dependent oxidoreductase, Rv2161c family [Asanoa hainanensis]|uniref:Probable F420-dependent oxidoreductase, Rv2161c family n=1 Tax=Asanoa hainanensis TaxID=560556 RepID=A0A239MUV7_9ACTN|nr:LLM class flavin-dependent oxidoreductase [Asanoa hainanensis]SNT46033.1 probable F420-dependent oxidoreductase, Rv2161c family [Asanoa hainanensis]